MAVSGYPHLSWREIVTGGGRQWWAWALGCINVRKGTAWGGAALYYREGCELNTIFAQPGSLLIEKNS